jgi:hypothetical protein
MGQIRKRGGVWWIRFYPNSQRLEESAKTSKYDVARGLLRDREGQISKGVPITARFDAPARTRQSAPRNGC